MRLCARHSSLISNKCTNRPNFRRSAETPGPVAPNKTDWPPAWAGTAAATSCCTNKANSPGQVGPCGGNRAKRSQFRQTGKRAGSPESENVQNEPNSAQPAGRPRAGEGKYAKRTQSEPGVRAPARPNMQNEPNSSTGLAGGPDPRRAKMRKTKPICAASRRSRAGTPNPRGAAGSDCAKRTQFLDCGFRIVDCGLSTDLRRDACPGAYRLRPARACCTNKPNWLGEYPLFQYSILPPFPSDANRAKQSQFPGGSNAGAIVSTLREKSCDTFFDNLRLFLSGPFRGRVRGKRRGSSRP